MGRRDYIFFFFLACVVCVILYLVIEEFYITKSAADVTMKDLPVLGTVPKELPPHDTIVADKPNSTENEIKQAEFYIILGSFRNRSEAQHLVDKMREKYTTDIILLPPTAEGNYRVSYRYYSSHEEASSVISTIRANIKSDAWIFSAVRVP